MIASAQFNKNGERERIGRNVAREYYFGIRKSTEICLNRNKLFSLPPRFSTTESKIGGITTRSLPAPPLHLSRKKYAKERFSFHVGVVVLELKAKVEGTKGDIPGMLKWAFEKVPSRAG